MENLQKDDMSQVLDPFALASLTFDEEQGHYVAVPEERPDLLTMKYPAMADRIKAVRAEDFSDREIEGMISDNIALAEAEGYTPEEIDRYYGITPESKSAVWESEREKEIQSYAAVYNEPRKKVIEDMREAEALGISYVHLRRIRELEASPETEPPFVLHVHERTHERVQPDDPVGDSMLIRTIGGLTVGFSGALSGTFRGINWLTGFNWADEAADNLDETMRTFQKEYLNGNEAGFYDSVMQGIGSTGYFLLPGTLAAKGAEKIGRVSPFLGRIFGASTSAAVESMGEAGSVYKEVLTRTGDEVSARGAASMTFWLNMPTNFISDKLAFFGEDEAIKGLLRRTGLFARASDRIVNAAGYLLRGLGGGVAEGIQETMQGAISEHYGKGTPWGQLDLLDILYEEGMPAMVSGALFGMAGSPKFADAIRQDVKGEQEVREKESARTVYDSIVEQATAAGRGEEEAKAAAAIWSARALVRSRQEGITAEEWFDKTLTSIEGGTFNAENGESYTHPANAGVDLGQKVPILDLSGIEGTSTPKELLARLKDMALKDEAWISRDAEVFARLPRGKKLRHIAYSSRSPHLENNRALRNEITGTLDELVQNAVLIESAPNNDPKKADVLNFHRLYVPVRTDAGVQSVRIVAEELKGSDSLKPMDVELYDVILEGKKESPDSTRPSLAGGVVTHPGAPFEVTIADMLRGVKDAEGKPYVGEAYQQSAYHGTPHRGIKKMSLKHIGTGEGNQVYGYGIYSAEARDTAEFYWKTLIGKTLVDFDPKEHVAFTTEDGGYTFKDGVWIGPDGGKVTSAGERVLSGLARGRFYSSMSLAEDIARYRKINAEDIAGMESHASELREELAQLENEGKAGSFQHRQTADELEGVLREMAPLQEELDWLDANPLTGEEITQPDAGQVYRLEVPENDVLLDRDAPLSKQPKKVKAAIRKIAKGLSPEALADLGGDVSLLTDPESTGGEFYRTLASLSDIGGEKGASMLLLEHGIPGLRYLDGMSRGAGEGTHNFVIWDEDAMSVEETYYQRQAEEKLTQDEKAWGETVDNFIAGRLQQNRPIRVMTTPIALKLASDEDVSFKEIVTSPAVLKKILKDKHVEITPDILKQLPRAMADPILVFKSATVPGSYVSMLELKDDKGGTVVVPVALNASKPGKQAFMTSVYGQIRKKTDGSAELRDSWFAEQIDSGNLRYINTEKSASWARDVGLQSPIMSLPAEALHELNIPTEADLVKSRFENPGFYQDERQQAPRGAYEAANRIIRLFESADASTLLHETGHAFLDDFARFIKSGRADIQVQADWSALMEWLGSDGKNPLTREQHEQFARGFEAYLLEGRAPSMGLRNVFEQFKNWLIGIYRGVEELNVTLSDEVRGVFDRMLATEGEIAENRVFYQDKAWNVPDDDEDAGLPPDDEQDWPNREAYMNAEEIADRIADGDESALFDPEWFAMPEDGTEGMAKVKNYQREEESAQIEAEAYEAFRQFAREIVEQGGVRYEDIVAMLGREAAAELRKKLPYVFRRTTTELGKLAQALFIDPEQLVARLQEAPKKPQQLEPVLEVNQETYPWIVERMGVKGAYDYLKRRLRAVEADRKAAEEAFEEARDSGSDEDELQMLRNNAWEAYRERGYIRDSLETLKGSLRDDTEKSTLPVSQTELNAQATVSAAKWVQKTVKEALAEVTGSTKIGDLVTEYEAYRRAMKMVQAESRRAFSAGRKDAMLKAALRRKELKRKKAERDKERGKIRRMVEEMNTATRGEVLWDRKNEIRELLEGYEFKRRNAKTLYDLQGKEKEKRTVASVRRELKEYVGENPDAALNPDDLAVLDKRTLDTMTLDELTELHGKVMKLRADGILELEMKKAERQEWLDRTREELYKAVGGRLGNPDKLVNPRTDTRGRKESFWDKVRANSQMMTRLLDFIDGYKDFKGKWYKTFYEPAAKAEDAFLVHKNQRFDRMKKVLEALNLDERQLGRVFYATQDPMSGIEKSYTLDECIHIYAGWFNERNRDAIMYGNGIDEAMAADIFSRLSDRHKALGKEVMQEFETHRQRYNDALVEYGNVGLIPEPNYLRMYRSNWTDAQGKSIDEGLEGVQNEIIRANGLRKLYADKSSSISRKVIKAEHQQPIALGILTTWQRAVQEQEHFIAYGALVKDLHALLNEPSDRITAGMQETVNNRFGREIYSKLEEWVSRLAVPDFYKGYKAIDQMPRKLRSNAAAAYLTFNIMSALKQPTSLALYLRYASPKQMILSMGRFVASPRAFIQAVQELDPQVKKQQIDRFLEELKATAKSGDSRYNRVLLKTLQIGAKPMLWLDMFVRCIGWDAVFNTELEKGATTEEARQRAQLATVNTQNSASPKDLPAYMASNEWLNLLVVFQNQGAKIWGAMTHDLYGDIKTGRVNEAFAGFAGLAIGAFLLSCLNKGDLPDDPEEALKWTAKEITGNIPLFGSGIVSGWEGFSGGSMLDTVARDIAGTFTKIGKGDFDDTAMNIYSAWSLAYGGTPVTVIRRALKAAKTGNPWELIGLHNRSKRKKALMIP